VVGPYTSPPANALVLTVDVKASARHWNARAGTMTHDHKRNGTTTLFAALDIRTGQVMAQCRKRPVWKIQNL